MTVKEIEKYIKEKHNVKAEKLFEDGEIFRRKDTKKWFGIIMNIYYSQVFKDATRDRLIDEMNVKLPPDLVASTKNVKGFAPAYHMNKKHWVTILINKVPASRIKSLIDISYEMTGKNKKQVIKQFTI